jgi:Rrf2 family protein
VDLSCKSEYALLALLELTHHYSEGQILQIKEIAAHQSIPDRYLEQLLGILRRSGLVRSQRGAKGGYVLAKPPWSITVYDVIHAIEGENPSLTNTDEQTTPEKETLRQVWQEAHSAAMQVLKKATLQDLYEQQTQRLRAGLMYYI